MSRKPLEALRLMRPEQMLPLEYETWYADNYLRENPSLSNREYWRAYPHGSRSEQWNNEITKAAYEGKVIAARVLDYLYRVRSKSYVTRFLFHDCPTAIPHGYLNPDTKRMNREHKKTKRILDKKATV